MSSVTLPVQFATSRPLGHEIAPFPADRRLYMSGHAVIAAVGFVLALVTASECRSILHLPSLLYGISLWGWWSLVASALWTIGEHRPAVSAWTARAMGMHVLAGSVLAALHLMLLGSLNIVPEWRVQGTGLSRLFPAFSINRFGLELLIYGFVFGITGIIQFQIRARRAALQSLELQRQLTTAHLRALQMQLEPHFLFNTLNAITTLVELGRQQTAAEMLAHLNAILKTTLARSTPELVPLSEELDFISNYMAIEQMRFADRLRCEFYVDPSAVDGMVPCFLLQPILENAIRHGISRCEEEGLVEALAAREGSSLHMCVRNTGSVSATQEPGYGIGLTNTRERLEHFYQARYEMRAQPLSGGGFEVTITIPYEAQTSAG